LFPTLNWRFLKKIIVANTAHLFIEKKLKKDNIKPNILWYNSGHGFVLSKKFDGIKIFDVMGLVHLESIKKDNSIIAKVKYLYYKYIELKALNNANQIITVNYAHRKEIEKIIKKEIIVIRDGFNKIFLDKYFFKKNKNIYILFVGSFFKNRLEGIINKISELIKNNENLFFEIIGDGKYVLKYKKIISDNRCEKKVNFTGHLENSKVYDNLKKADICFSDDWSYIGFPTKVFEYMAMGKAVLVEDTPAVREIISPGKNGLLYKNPDDFVKKVLWLAKNKQYGEKIGRQAKIDAKEHTWDKRQNEFNKIISDIYEKKI
jgi:glycosyltransferase involved in cell wall biosynthesis